MRDVSRSGIYLETDDPLPDIGERVIIRFPIPHASRHQLVVLTTEVVRLKGSEEKPGTGHGFAARFVMVDGRRPLPEDGLDVRATSSRVRETRPGADESGAYERGCPRAGHRGPSTLASVV